MESKRLTGMIENKNEQETKENNYLMSEELREFYKDLAMEQREQM